MPIDPQRIKVVNPATLEPFAEMDCTPLDRLSAILDRAREAQRSWASIPLGERKAAIRRLQELVCQDALEIARTVSGETGKPRIDALNVDVMAGVAAVDYSVRSMEQLLRRRPVDLGSLRRSMRLIGRSSYLAPRPLGVIAVISPWNYPFCIPFSQAAMATAAGNAVVIKPSSLTPCSAVKIVESFERAGFPAGLVQAVVGGGDTVGRALLSSDVDKVIFTGSSDTGREIMAECSDRLTPVVLELGGKDPMLVLDDADLDRAAEGAVWGAFVNAGQTCAGVKRIIVQQGVHDRFLEAIARRTEALKLGWGWDDPDVSVGPLINEAAVEDMERLVASMVAEGARLVCGGRRPVGLRGSFYEPTLLDCDAGMRAGRDREVFGPVATVLKAKDEEDALQIANDCSFALCASVWTKDIDKGKRVAERLIGGTAVVNNTPYTYGLAATPWGGSRQSGFGRTHGPLGFDELLEWHHVHVDKGSTRRDIWWHPYDREKLEASQEYLRVTFSSDRKGRLAALRRISRLMNRK